MQNLFDKVRKIVRGKTQKNRKWDYTNPNERRLSYKNPSLKIVDKNSVNYDAPQQKKSASSKSSSSRSSSRSSKRSSSRKRNSEKITNKAELKMFMERKGIAWRNLPNLDKAI